MARCRHPVITVAAFFVRLPMVMSSSSQMALTGKHGLPFPPEHLAKASVVNSKRILLIAGVVCVFIVAIWLLTRKGPLIDRPKTVAPAFGATVEWKIVSLTNADDGNADSCDTGDWKGYVGTLELPDQLTWSSHSNSGILYTLPEGYQFPRQLLPMFSEKRRWKMAPNSGGPFKDGTHIVRLAVQCQPENLTHADNRTQVPLFFGTVMVEANSNSASFHGVFQAPEESGPHYLQLIAEILPLADFNYYAALKGEVIDEKPLLIVPK